MGEFATFTPYWEALVGAVITVAKLALIIVPLMVAVELLRHFDLLDRWSRRIEPGARWLGMSAEAALPLVAGTAFGISYGSGLIIGSAREGRITPRDGLLLTSFLAPFHAVFEDTLLFVPVGVNPFLLLSLRFFTAVALTLILARFGLAGSLASSAGVARQSGDESKGRSARDGVGDLAPDSTSDATHMSTTEPGDAAVGEGSVR